MRVVAATGVRKSVWLVAAACFLAAMAVLLLVFVSDGADRPAPLPDPPPAPVAAPAAPVPERATASVPKVHARRVAPPPAETASPTPAEPPEREDPIVSFGPPGERTGVKLFPPMGTKPVKIGIVVPEEFEVPEGYVRHFQVTEDGQMLPAILLFHPDYEWVDDAGRALPLPPDRVVPPEMAPPGLPIQMLTPPPAPEGER